MLCSGTVLQWYRVAVFCSGTVLQWYRVAVLCSGTVLQWYRAGIVAMLAVLQCWQCCNDGSVGNAGSVAVHCSKWDSSAWPLPVSPCTLGIAAFATARLSLAAS